MLRSVKLNMNLIHLYIQNGRCVTNMVLDATTIITAIIMIGELVEVVVEVVVADTIVIEVEQIVLVAVGVVDDINHRLRHLDGANHKESIDGQIML